MWYDIADEMGMMIVDEYGWWYDPGTKPDILANEYKTTIDQRQTHPSIIFWDAQNETGSWDHTTVALKSMGMDYDISNRCWDNGMQPPLDENQPTEYHPYPFWGMLNLTDVARLNNMTDQYPSGGGQHTADTCPNPIIINEYAELWLNRNGDPTTISRTSYETMMPDSTAEERLEWYADFIAILTEFWRAGRNIAGIQYFSGLTYSKPTAQGATGDLLLPDISVPTVRPSTQSRVKNAFAKLGICIQKYDVTTMPGLDFDFPVTLYNDLNEDINNLEVLFKVTCNGRVLAEETKIYNLASVGDLNGNDLQSQIFSFITPKNLNNGDRIIVTASYTRNGETVESVRKLTCQGFEDINNQETEELVSVGMPTEASSYEGNAWYLAPKFVTDGTTDSSNNRWGSTPKSEDEWITVDLGSSKKITNIKLYWTAFAYGTEYKIQVSNDNSTWTDIEHVTNGVSAEIREITVPKNTVARYVRMQGLKYGGGSSSYSLYEFEVYAEKIELLLYSNGKKVETSGIIAWWGAAGNVNDGNLENRWCSPDNAPDSWITVDLGKKREIAKVDILWMNYSTGKEYKIQVSDDNINWTDAYHYKNGVAGTHSISLPSGIFGRYVRMQGIEARSTSYSIHELYIYVKIDEKKVDFESVSLNEKALSINLRNKNHAQLYAYTNPIDANNIRSCSWTSDNEAVATVNKEGLITAISSGSTNITYTLTTLSDDIYSATCEVKVSNDEPNITSSILTIIDKLSTVKCNGSTVSAVVEMFDDKDKLEALNADGTIADLNDTIKTGMIINKIIDGVVSDSITIVVRGDLSKSGNTTSIDALLAKQLAFGLINEDNVLRSAADFDGNGKITAYDILNIKIVALNLG